MNRKTLKRSMRKKDRRTRSRQLGGWNPFNWMLNKTMKRTAQNKSVSNPASYLSAFANRLKPKYANPYDQVFDDFSAKLRAITSGQKCSEKGLSDPLSSVVSICLGTPKLDPIEDDSGYPYLRYENSAQIFIHFIRVEQFDFNVIWLTTHAIDDAKQVVICGFSEGGSMALLCGKYLKENKADFFNTCSFIAIAPYKCLPDDTFRNLPNVQVYVTGTEFKKDNETKLYVDHSYFESTTSSLYNYLPVKVLNFQQKRYQNTSTKEITLKRFVTQVEKNILEDSLLKEFYPDFSKIKIDKEKNVFHSKDAYLCMFQAQASTFGGRKSKTQKRRKNRSKIR
jgi:hypothetical protein